MRRHLLIAFLLCTVVMPVAHAQFYPDSDATWCMQNSEQPAGYNIVAQMGSAPDTLIDGVVYKRIYQYSDQFGSWYQTGKYYVRSTPDGRAYAYLLNAQAEYLTADLNASVGDTVYNVLSINTAFSTSPTYCQPNGEFISLVKVVVDFIVQVTSGGNLVDRYYLDSPCWPDDGHGPWHYFWQAGVGTSGGALLNISDGLSRLTLLCCEVDGDMAYVIAGNFCLCPFLPLNLAERADAVSVRVHPNPSAGLFTVSSAGVALIRVQDAQGRALLTTRHDEIDLSAHPPGVYTAVVTTATGRQAVRLVLCSP